MGLVDISTENFAAFVSFTLFFFFNLNSI